MRQFAREIKREEGQCGSLPQISVDRRIPAWVFVQPGAFYFLPVLISVISVIGGKVLGCCLPAVDGRPPPEHALTVRLVG
jgi:hypothetical protein